MKLKLHTWRRIAALAISLAIPVAAEGGKQSRDVVDAGKGGTTTMKTSASQKNGSGKQKPQAVADKPTGTASPGAETSGTSLKIWGGVKCRLCGKYTFHVHLGPFRGQSNASQLEKGSTSGDKAEGISDAKDPKQTKPVVRAQALAAKSNAKKRGATKAIKFDGIDGEFRDKDHKNWSVEQYFLQKPLQDTGLDDQGKLEKKNRSGRGKVKVSDIPIIKTVDKATAQ